MGLIQIEGMEFYAYHGCFKEEQIIGNKFIVDLSVEANLEKASNTDNIQDTLNYQTMYELIQVEMKEKSHLLEHIGKRILDRIFEKFDGIELARIKVSKINPPMGGKIDQVSVTLTR